MKFFSQRKIIFPAMVLGMALASAAHAKAGKKPAAKDNWCCMVGGEVLQDKSKKVCIKAAAMPTDKSKSKLTQKYVKSCQKKEGAWEKDKPAEAKP